MSLKIIIGCMFSGKTSEVMREYTRWNNIGKKAIIINYYEDERYGTDNYVYNHDLNKKPCIKTKNLNDVSKDILMENDVILINEGQFFSDLFDFCLLWCETHHKNIIVSGLDGDYLRKPFGQIYLLIPLADQVIKLKSFCKKCNDGTQAIFSKRISDEKDDIVIGAGEKYIPVCRKHYLN
mgnify:CR=1 FL=1